NESDFDTELAVPDSLPSSVEETADAITADADNQWEAAVLLQAYFRGGDFEYSLDAPEKASGDASSDFLSDKKGYCVQCSSATTMGSAARRPCRLARAEGGGAGSAAIRPASTASPWLCLEVAGWVSFDAPPAGSAGEPPAWTPARAALGRDWSGEAQFATPS